MEHSVASAGVEACGLRKRWGPTQAVDGVDLVVAPGEVVALLGPNGAGKSTTIDMLLGLSQPDAGRVLLWGLPPATACAEGYVGALLQAGGMLGSVTVRELVEFMRRLSAHPLPLDQILVTSQTTAFADSRADRLSGGQAQRVRFALAISGDPELLVLDEPTVGMDVMARRGFWAAMRQWTARGRTVIFATHYLDEADAFADRVVLMAHGRIVADGSTSEIKAAVGGGTIRATVPGATADRMRALPGVGAVEQRGEVITLRCIRSDPALHALLAEFPRTHDIEVTNVGLEEAFLALTEPLEVAS
jgi:ABC-2 type transport system ATP-binding protein